jgi:outer membrane protein OmpA-like peptidoglycan-associated protein
MMKKILCGLLLTLSITVNADTYDYDFSTSQQSGAIPVKVDPIMNGSFLEIIRFNEISFAEEVEDDDRSSMLNEIVDKIKEYKDKEIIVSIIGHTEATTDDMNEKTVDSDTYANTIQNIFRDSLGEYCSADRSHEYAKEIQNRLIDRGVDKNITTLEYRNGKDILYSDGTDEGRDLSNRVMVTIYVPIPKDVDLDEDGVMDSTDRCLNTPKGITVNRYGCPVDLDGDGVLDDKDRCAQTPKRINVDKYGCPLDSDGDGVLDYQDRCANTVKGSKIDEYGCPITKILAINFASKSAKIGSNYHAKIVEFAEFLNQYPEYRAEIIGHTDSIDKEAKNMKLSQERALAVKTALEEEGIESTRLTSSGRGELDPIKTNRTAEGRKANRRIEVKLSY